MYRDLLFINFFQMQDIYKDGTYLAINPSWGEEDAVWKADLIRQLIQRNHLNPASITDLGCGTGGILHALDSWVSTAARLEGYDISPQAIQRARKYENDRLTFHCMDWPFKQMLLSDLLLVIDVVEHVQDYISFLQEIKKFAEHFIFHIPLDLSCRTILKPHVLLQQRLAVGHIHYFTAEHVQWILKDSGYKVIDRMVTFSETDRNAAHSFRQRIKKAVRKISYTLFPTTSMKLWGGYSLLLLCEKNG